MAEGLRCGGCGGEPGPGDVACRRCGRLLERALPVGGGSGADAVSEATRFLCAGAYLDEGFSRGVIGELFGQTFRAVAPSYGFDVELVAAHCLAARRQRRVRDGLLGVVGLLLIVMVGPFSTVLFGLFWAVAGWAVSSFAEGADGLRRAIDRLSWRSIAFAAVAAGLALLVAGIVSAAMNVLGLLFAAGSEPSPVTPGGALGSAVVAFVKALLLGIGGWFVLYVIVLVDLHVRRGVVVHQLRRAPFQERPRRPAPPGGRLADRLAAVASGQSGNVTVYSGFDPFVGTGDEVPGWSFAIPIVAAEGRQGPLQKFSVAELAAHVRRRMEAIGPGRTAGPGQDRTDYPLDGLVVSDHVFVSGLAIEGDGLLFTARGAPPLVRLDRDEVMRIVDDPHGPVRYYCMAQVRSWGGEIVTSVLLHFSTDGEKLYFELVKRVLPPVRAAFHQVDTMPVNLSPGTFARMAADAAGRTVALVVGAPLRIVADLAFDVRGDRPEDDGVIDYGARLSVRELGGERTWYPTRMGCRHNYFQALDADKHLKVVERHAIAAILEFLEEHGVDTSEFTARVTTVLNNSVTVTGSNNVLGAVATGPSATATQSGTIGVQPGAGAGGRS